MSTPISSHISLLSTSLAASKRQAYFARMFGGNLGEQGEITELFQKLLICSVADLCIQQMGGNIVEIGAAEGKATVALAEIAATHGRRVLVVDPYNGEQEGTAAIYSQFQQATAPYLGTVQHLRESSQTDHAVEVMRALTPSFVFVDGLHHEWAAYSDIRAAFTALPVGGYVCVDDTNGLKRDAGAAFQRVITEGMFQLVELPVDVESVLYTYKSWHFGVKVEAPITSS